ncbi:KGK domain-containing protein [Synechococcus sp. B60.2]|uniref:KGK domain-containing protein n=1 Tax=unclassified Synechococcus TaxID=2626047 RepID=UPI0039C24DF6
MLDSILLKADDKETAVAIGDQIYIPSVLHSAIIDYLLADIARTNSHLRSKKIHVEIRALVEGVKSRILQPRKDWAEGKVSLKVCLEFIPDSPSRDSELDSFRNTGE